MNGFLHCALCFTKSNISQAYTHIHTHTYTRACWLVLILWYTHYTPGRVGTIHHLKRSKYTTVIRLEAPAAPRTPWPGAREHLGKCSFLTLSSAEYTWLHPLARLVYAHRQTDDEDEVRLLPQAHLSSGLRVIIITVCL